MPDRIISQLQWVELPGGAGTVLRAGAPRPDLPPSPILSITVFPTPLPLEDWAKVHMPIWVEYFTDIKVLSDKPSLLKDGTPARELEIEAVFKNGPKANGLLLDTKKESAWISITLIDDKKIGENLKKIAYSLTFLPGREEPVDVPPDVRAFFDMYCTDIVSHDVKTIMAHFSDRFLWGGMSKAFLEQWFRNDPSSPIQRGNDSCEATVTVLEARGDKAYVDGFLLGKAKGDASVLKWPMQFQQIINEHGEWRWFGNQK